MKRNKNLQPLSRQHHNALMAVLLLKKGLNKQADVNVMCHFILTVWNNELQNHFQLEENWLKPASDSNHHILYQRMISEHAVIEKFIDLFHTNKYTAAVIDQFQQLLEQHIRFEDRIFFPLLETVLSTDELAGIGAAFAETESVSCANYTVKFWE